MPAFVTIQCQPYSSESIAVMSVQPVVANNDSPSWIKHRAEKGWVEITGIRVSGSTTSRLFHATSTREMPVEFVTEHLPRDSYERGSHVFCYL